MNQTVIDRIKNCPTLPSLPAIAVQVLDAAKKQEVDIAEIARIISKDPALSGKILRTVNSSFYARAQAVSTISQSLVILGLQSVKTLVLGFSLVSNLSAGKQKGFKHLGYWKHSIYNATAARLIAGKLGVVQHEEAFLIGLLADIGTLVLDQVLGQEYSDAVAAADSHVELSALERAAFEMTHADVSGIMAEQWKLPPLLSVPVSHHDRPAEVTDPQLRKLSEIAEMSSRCADVFVDEDAAHAIADVRVMCDRFGLNDAAADELLAEIGTRSTEVAPLFEINIGKSEPFDAILKRANETLIQLTLQSQMQAQNLQEQNRSLKHEAMTDRLTGLANRSGFEQESATLFADAEKAGTPLSMLLLDLDKFKNINDTFGHPAGDEVLRAVGKILKGAARSQDLVARYGGEELVLILPDTPRPIAAVIAETIRKAVAAKPVVAGATSIAVTASIGVASFEPTSPLKTLAHIIKAADLALYNAKHTGRNRVKVFNPAPVNKAA